MGEPPGFFSTHACDLYSLIRLIGLDTYEIGVILVVYEDAFIADLQCAMTRPEML
jgi:hypothetical protein